MAPQRGFGLGEAHASPATCFQHSSCVFPCGLPAGVVKATPAGEPASGIPEVQPAGSHDSAASGVSSSCGLKPGTCTVHPTGSHSVAVSNTCSCVPCKTSVGEGALASGTCITVPTCMLALGGRPTAPESASTPTGRTSDQPAGPSVAQTASAVASYLWGLSPVHEFEALDLSKLSPSALSAWLTAEPEGSSSRPFRVEAASSATTALRLPAWWQLLPDSVVPAIMQAKSQWPLSYDEWLAAGFSVDHDWEFLSYVLLHGAPICALDCLPGPFKVANYKSFAENETAARSILAEEFEAGYLLVPPQGCSARFLHPLGCVPKKLGSVRIIHDLSAPVGRSVNASQKYWYRRFSVADEFAAMLSPGCYIGRLDVKAYYRNFGVDPLYWPLQGFAVREQAYFDTRMNFGMRNAPEIADRFSSALVRDAARHGVPSCMAVVDDFTVVHRSQQECGRQWAWLCNRMCSLGFKLSEGPGKTEPPAQVATVLGLVYDTVNMTVGLDPAKLEKLRRSVNAVMGCKKVKRKQLESLVGFLVWVSRVIYAGRSFCHHLKVAVHSVSRPQHWVYLNAACKRELQWWAAVAPSLNGCYPVLPPAPALWKDFQVDASTSGGPEGQPCIGIWVQGGYASLSHEQLSKLFVDCPARDAHINTWELYAVLVCVRLYADFLAGGHWRVRTDSASVEGWLMRGECRDDPRHEFIAEIATTSVAKYFRITAKHIPGAQNCMADALSRCRFDEVRVLLDRWIATRSDLWVDSAAAPVL